MTVHINPAGHHHHPGGIQDVAGVTIRIGGRFDDRAVLNPQVVNLAVDSVGRVVDVAAGDLQ